MNILKQRLNNNPLLWSSLLILLIGFACAQQRKTLKCEDLLVKMQQQNDTLSAKIDSLTSLRTKYRELLEMGSKLDSSQIEQLRRKGLSDPVEDIITDLRKHNELIPFKGVLGGTMGFYSSEDIMLISKWVFAPFEDGHIGGYMLLEYKVSSDGKISWKVIDAYLK
jgi:hypothetical protein